MPAAPDPADALSRDLRAYLRLLDRCGIRHLAQAGESPMTVPVIDPSDWDTIAKELASAANAKKQRPALLPREEETDEEEDAPLAAPVIAAEAADADIEESPAAVPTTDEGEVTVEDAPPENAEPLDASPETDELRHQAEAEATAQEAQQEADADTAPAPSDDPDQLDLFGGL